jgi:O-antigen/teichoic acid export membrane protein
LNIKILSNFGLGQIYGALVAFLALPLLTRLLSVEDVAAYGVFQQVLTIAMILFTFGLDQAFVREYAYASNVDTLFFDALWPGLVVLLWFLCINAIFFEHPLRWFFSQKSTAWQVLIVSAYVVLNYLYKYYFLMLRVRLQGLDYSISQVLQRTSLITILFLAFHYEISLDFFDVILANLICLFLSFLYCVWRAKIVLIFSISGENVKRLLSYGLPMSIAGGVSWAQGFVGVYYLQSSGGSSDLAVYTVALSVTGVISILQGVFATVWGPYAYEKIKDKNFESEFNSLIKKISIGVVLAYMLFCSSRWVIQLVLPIKYSEVSSLVLYTAIVPFIYVFSEVVGFGVFVAKRVKTYTALTLLGLVVNFSLIEIWFHAYGIRAVVIANLITALMMLLAQEMLSNIYWRKLKTTPVWVALIGITALSVYMDMYLEFDVYQSSLAFFCCAILILLYMLGRCKYNES